MHARHARPFAALILEILAVLLIGALCLAGLTGCTPGRREPATTVTGPAGQSLVQNGSAAEPATADTATGSAALTIPAGTAVTVAPDGSATFTAAEPVEVVSRFSSFKASGPRAFTPPAAPTPAALADGRARLGAWIALGLGCVAFFVGMVKAFPSAIVGGVGVAGAALVVIALGKVPDWVWTLGFSGLAVTVFGLCVWQLYLKKRYSEPAPPSPSPA
jgi:hypothetical protein